MKRAALLALALAVGVGCKPPANAPPPRSTLVVGLDISGSFRKSGQFDDAMRYAALYIYGHINALGGLKQTTDVFVGSLGGEHVGQPKSFHPIQDLSGKTPAEIEASLRAWFPEDDPITDFNSFFQRTAVHIKRQNLVLAPLNIVLFSDGVPDFPGAGRMAAAQLYAKIDVSPIEYLSRNVTIRLLYAQPTVAQNWEKLVPRNRVKIWTQDQNVMVGWHRHEVQGVAMEQQDSLWSWTQQIVDFRVRLADRSNPRGRIRGRVGHEPPPQLVTQLPKARRLAPVLHEGKQSPDATAQCAPLVSPLSAVTRPVLRPANRSAQPRRPELVRIEQLLGEHPHRPFERVKHVVQRDDSATDEMRAKEVDILLRPAIGVVAVDPEEPDRAVPATCEVTGEQTMGFDRALDTGGPE
jgi:hypothetical protein